MKFGNDYVPVNFTGGTDNYFFGVVSDSFFDEVKFHTNQNGGSVKIDGIYYSSPASVPEPTTLLLLSTGLVGLIGFGRKKIC
jgi:hypothetical protein